MSAEACGLCGKDPAEGFATVDDVRYCHGDFTPDPTCYMAAQAPVSQRVDWIVERLDVPEAVS